MGDDPEFAAMFQSPARAPVAARWAVPIAMMGVDDTGHVDASFWTDLRDESRMTLLHIAERALQWLRGDHMTLSESRPEWLEAEAHTFRKVSIVSQYRRLAHTPSLVAADARLRPEWIVPVFHPCLQHTDDAPLVNWQTVVEEVSPGHLILTLT